MVVSEQPFTHVVKRTGAVVPFNTGRITNAIYRAAVAVGGRDRETAERLAQRVVDVLAERFPKGHMPAVEEIQDAVEKVLIEQGHAKVAKAYILYREERAQRRRQRAIRSAHPSTNIPWSKLWEVLNWAVEHDLHTVEGLNARIGRGEFGSIVRESDRAYDEDVTTAAEMVRERLHEIRLVIIAGPSSSGKTTTTVKLKHLLGAMGMNLVALSVDNYFFDLELHPKDEFGDYDFETPQALDLDLINQHLDQLISGEEILVPVYDFKTGTRHDAQTSMRVGPQDVILIDSLHGLHHDLTMAIADELKFKLYIEPLLQMKDQAGRFVRWTDLRLMRRMVRDAMHRSYDPERTLLHWHYVRKSELRNIIPYVNSADYVVNSALPYELPVMRSRLLNRFEGWAVEYRDDPLQVDASERAVRVRDLLRAVMPVAGEGAIPPDSLLREFIGGSCYEY
jgi:uridine kinase